MIPNGVNVQCYVLGYEVNVSTSATPPPPQEASPADPRIAPTQLLRKRLLHYAAHEEPAYVMRTHTCNRVLGAVSVSGTYAHSTHSRDTIFTSPPLPPPPAVNMPPPHQRPNSWTYFGQKS